MDEKKPKRERRALRYPPSMKRPKEWLRFIQSDEFEQCWAGMKLIDNDLRALEIMIMLNPDGCPIIRDTGGIRKGRFAPDRWNTGKSGAARIYYLYLPDKGIVWLLFAHAKAELESISAAQKRQLRALVKEILAYFE